MRIDLDIRLIEAAEAQHRLVDVRLLRQLGVDPHQWYEHRRRDMWVQVTPIHYRHIATPFTFEMQLRAGAEWLGRRGALFGTTALHWLGVHEESPSRAEFLVARTRRSVPNWMTIHTSKLWNPGDAIRHNGIRTTTAGRALVDLASQMPSARTLESLIDNSIRLRRTSVTNLQHEFERVERQGRRGIVLLKEVLLDSGGESFLERRFLRLLRTAGYPRPECQITYRANGRHVARVDFRIADVVIEVSGRLGHSSDRERQKDARRRNALQQIGVTVLEFTTADIIDDPAYVLGTLEPYRALLTGRP
jgi:hypothetical protein